MELKLENGCYVPGKYQGFERVSGSEELLQRVLMKLKARRGSFLPMPEYGSRLYLLPREKPSNRTAAAKSYVSEALEDEVGLKLEGLTVEQGETGELTLSLSFLYNGELSFETLAIV